MLDAISARQLVINCLVLCYFFKLLRNGISELWFIWISVYVQGGTAIRGGQRFANFYCTSFKTNICVDTEGAL